MANLGIAQTPSKTPKTKADPNGYYEVCGLDPDGEYSDEDIRRAYWSKAKEYHPDGSAPDEELFHRVQMAYAVLKDPESRAKYDELDPSEIYLDEDVVAAIIKNMVGLKDRTETINALKDKLNVSIGRKVTKPKAPPAPPGPEFDSFAYYFYEGEEVPSVEIREKWVAHIVHAMWDRGMRGEIRVGFTQGDHHVVSKPWGDILMASGEPSRESAKKLLEKSVDIAS